MEKKDFHVVAETGIHVQLHYWFKHKQIQL